MKRIKFVLTTEFHLLTAISLISDIYHEGNGYLPSILQVGEPGNSRFGTDLNHDVLGIQYDIIPGEIKDQVKGNWKKVISRITAEKLDTLVIFHEQKPINVFLAKTFRSKGAKICLAPDGAKPYIKVEKSAFPSRIKETVNTYKLFFSLGLYVTRPYFLSWNYAELPEIDEVWVRFPEKCINNGKPVVKIDLLQSPAAIELSSKVFNFAEEVNPVFETSEIVFYINNILYQQPLYDAEYDIIRAIARKIRPNHKLIMKFHPATPADHVDRLRALEGVFVFRDAIPAELYLAKLERSVVLSMWSNALLTNNPRCNYYWLLQILIEENIMLPWLKVVNPSDFIQEVHSIEEIKYPFPILAGR